MADGLRVTLSQSLTSLAEGSATGNLELYSSGGSFNWLEDNGAPYSAYYPKGSDTYANSTNDISGNDRHITSGNMPEGTWSSGVGWTTNGTNNFVSITVPIGANYTVACKFSNHTGSAGRYLYGGGFFGSAPYHQVQPYNGTAPGQVRYQYGAGTDLASSASGITEGVICTSGPNLYVNGVLADSSTDVWSGNTDGAIYWGARKVFGPSGYIAATLEALIIFDKTLDADEAMALYNGMLTL